MDVRLHLAGRYLERLCDLLVTELLEVEQHQRHALVVGETADRLFEAIVPFRRSISSARDTCDSSVLSNVVSAPGVSSSLKNLQRAR